ncbi:MAG: fumarylacetoacetate hydrolase family protein [Thermoplasmatota archaeon]
MKLATIRVEQPASESEARDGRLVVVDDVAGKVAVVPDEVAPNLLAAIREWDALEPMLRELDAELKAGNAPDTRSIEDVSFMAPLPRTTCWIDGSAYIHHIVLVRKARNAEPPATLRTTPLMYQGAADPLLGPNDDIVVTSEDYGIDLEAEVGVILDDVPMGTPADAALEHVKLLCVMNDVSLRNLIPAELAAGFGFFHGKPPTSFAPFVVTPDEIGDAWKDGRIHLKMASWINGEFQGDPDAGPEMFFGFHDLIAHAAKTRPLPAGTILGSGTVSNEDEARGSSCLAETRMLEIIKDGKPTTEFLKFGDRVTIDVKQDGRSVFGTIDQKIAKAEPA